MPMQARLCISMRLRGRRVYRREPCVSALRACAVSARCNICGMRGCNMHVKRCYVQDRRQPQRIPRWPAGSFISGGFRRLMRRSSANCPPKPCASVARASRFAFVRIALRGQAQTCLLTRRVRRLSDGDSPYARLYSIADRPRCAKPHLSAISVTDEHPASFTNSTLIRSIRAR